MDAGGEAELIARHFQSLGAARADVLLGIGDDAALLRPQPGCELVQTTDVLIEGVHFLPGSPPRSLGHRALAVNLSDLAAMGATPAWALLSLTLPAADDQWLAEFAAGFGALARAHQVALVGGNLSRGPLGITVLMSGQVGAGTALRRSTARPGDELWISGTLGDAAAGLALLRTAAQGTAPPGHAVDADDAYLRRRFEYPTPRLALGAALRGVASACIDLSDGLLADLPRLAEASGCRAELDVARLPLSTPLQARCGAAAWERALVGGEDYELCFAAPPVQQATLRALAARLAVPLACCGRLQAGAGMTWLRGADVIQFSQSAFDHFQR